MMRPAPPLPSPRTSRPGATARREREDRETARLRVLEFVWTTAAGCQPVLYVVRTYLH
jgi:hypothetical protein